MTHTTTHSLKYWQIRIFILCWLAYAFVYFGRVNISIAMLELQNFFNTDKTTVGMLGSVFFYTYATGQLINGIISDKVSSRLYIFIGLFTTGCSNILFSLSTSFNISIVIWALNGIGQSMLWSSIVKTAGLWFEPKQYTKVIVGLNTSMVFGYIMAWGGSGLLLRFFSWQKIFLIPGITLVSVSILWFIMARNSPQSVGLTLDHGYDKLGKSLTQNSHTTHISLKQLFFTTGLILVVIACIAQGMVKEGLGIWSPSIFTEMYQIDMSKASLYILLIPIMNLFGILFAGVLNSWCKQRERLTIVILLLAACSVFLILLFFAKYSIVIGILGIGLASGFMYGANTMLLGVVPIQYSKYGRAAFVTGFLDFCSYFGAGTSSFLIGRVLDSSHGISNVFIIWIIIIAIAMISLTMPRLLKLQK